MSSILKTQTALGRALSTVPGVKTHTIKEVIVQQLAETRNEGKFKEERIITTPQDANLRLQSGQSVINLCSNNYLGLSNHPKVISAAKEAMEKHGYGLSSVRFICGTQDIHKELEQCISEFHGMEDTILYTSCFDANAGLFEALLGKEDIVFSDALNHASIIDGIRLCKAKRIRYQHIDMNDLRRHLESEESRQARFRLIATDGVFSMDGEIAPLREICDLADEFDAYVFVDECHATGVLGPTGRGTDEYCGVQGRVDIINSTLGKALGGGTGGYTTSSKEIVELLRQKSRPYLFSNSLPPSIIGASLGAFKILAEDNQNTLHERLKSNMIYFRSAMESHFQLRGTNHPIVPIMIYNAQRTQSIAFDLLNEGVYVVGFCYPVVPEEKARIRVQLSAAHKKEQLERAVEKFIKVGQKYKD